MAEVAGKVTCPVVGMLMVALCSDVSWRVFGMEVCVGTDVGVAVGVAVGDGAGDVWCVAGAGVGEGVAVGLVCDLVGGGAALLALGICADGCEGGGTIKMKSVQTSNITTIRVVARLPAGAVVETSVAISSCEKFRCLLR